MEAIVLEPLNALDTSLSSLIASLTTSPTFATAPAVTDALLSADDALTRALITLRQHQQNYAKILHLRAEALSLEDQIKNTVRTCGELRAQIGAINPRILEDSDDDEEDDARPQDVDYKTLLSFARRIGKHNAAAARQAERDADKRIREAKTRAAASAAAAAAVAATAATPPQATMNGVVSQGGVAPPPLDTANVIPDNEQIWLNENAAAKRAAEGMAFPAAERLRMGMLGKLQLIREQGGDEAVDKEIERLMTGGGGDGDVEKLPSAHEEPMDVVSPKEATRYSAGTRMRRPSATTAGRPPLPPQRRKSVQPLNLDLWDGDSDEDDDES